MSATTAARLLYDHRRRNHGTTCVLLYLCMYINVCYSTRFALVLWISLRLRTAVLFSSQGARFTRGGCFVRECVYYVYIGVVCRSCNSRARRADIVSRCAR